MLTGQGSKHMRPILASATERCTHVKPPGLHLAWHIYTTAPLHFLLQMLSQPPLLHPLTSTTCLTPCVSVGLLMRRRTGTCVPVSVAKCTTLPLRQLDTGMASGWSCRQQAHIQTGARDHSKLSRKATHRVNVWQCQCSVQAVHRMKPSVGSSNVAGRQSTRQPLQAACGHSSTYLNPLVMHDVEGCRHDFIHFHANHLFDVVAKHECQVRRGKMDAAVVVAYTAHAVSAICAPYCKLEDALVLCT